MFWISLVWRPTECTSAVHFYLTVCDSFYRRIGNIGGECRNFWFIGATCWIDKRGYKESRPYAPLANEFLATFKWSAHDFAGRSTSYRCLIIASGEGNVCNQVHHFAVSLFFYMWIKVDFLTKSFVSFFVVCVDLVIIILEMSNIIGRIELLDGSSWYGVESVSNPERVWRFSNQFT